MCSPDVLPSCRFEWLGESRWLICSSFLSLFVPVREKCEVNRNRTGRDCLSEKTGKDIGGRRWKWWWLWWLWW